MSQQVGYLLRRRRTQVKLGGTKRTAGEHKSPMDVIKQVVKYPHVFGILAHEFAIRWCVVCWLYQADVSSDDLFIC